MPCKPRPPRWFGTTGLVQQRAVQNRALLPKEYVALKMRPLNGRTAFGLGGFFTEDLCPRFITRSPTVVPHDARKGRMLAIQNGYLGSSAGG